MEIKGSVKKMDETQMRESLRLGVRKVTFTKADGSTRIMRCTLMSHLLPPLKGGGTHSETSKKVGFISVWDMDKEAWRGFFADTVQEFEVSA